MQSVNGEVDVGMKLMLLLQGEDGAGPNVMPSGGGGFEFGVDPNEDPELALALRVSMEEQRARQQERTDRFDAGLVWVAILVYIRIRYNTPTRIIYIQTFILQI